jgi:predicted RNase H-like nuclease
MTATARCFGVDLAWSDNQLTGVCALDDGGVIVDEQLLATDDEIVAWVKTRLDGPAILAVDAPLEVPNETGRRAGENEVASVYGGRKAGPHSSNRSLFMRRYGRIRGEDLAARFADLGFGGPWAGADRTLLEIYPHPAIIEAFDLSERLLYKAKPGLGPEGRRTGLRNLGRLLAALEHADPPMIGPEIAVGDDVRGRGAKAIEDRMDARVAAWVAAVWARHGTDRMRLFGDPEQGHIAVPIGPFVERPIELEQIPPPGIGGARGSVVPPPTSLRSATSPS